VERLGAAGSSLIAGALSEVSAIRGSPAPLDRPSSGQHLTTERCAVADYLDYAPILDGRRGETVHPTLLRDRSRRTGGGWYPVRPRLLRADRPTCPPTRR
jgi:hypothetical protein